MNGGCTLVAVYAGRRTVRRVPAHRVLTVMAQLAQAGRVHFMYAGPDAQRSAPSLTCWRWRRRSADEVVTAGVYVGMWTMPYKRPRGTRAVRVEAIDGATVHLSDGTSMHVSYATPVDEGSVFT